MQTDKILSIIDNFDTPSILIGDYNLRHDTNSFARLSKGRQDLIKESGVTSTRTSFYEKTEYLFADYALVDNGITVTSFQVLDDEVSDHKAMILEIETR